MFQPYKTKRRKKKIKIKLKSGFVDRPAIIKLNEIDWNSEKKKISYSKFIFLYKLKLLYLYYFNLFLNPNIYYLF